MSNPSCSPSPATLTPPLDLYAVAIGSNRRHGRHGPPERTVAAAIAELDRLFSLFTVSPIIGNRATGGAGRDFANAVALVESPLEPPAMLDAIKDIERAFGRRPGKRWAARVLDLDLVLWSGGDFRCRDLTIPHPRLALRDFVLGPLASIAPDWRVQGALSIRHLQARLGKRRPRR